MDPFNIQPLSVDNWPALADLLAAGGDPKWCSFK
jgi:hypothetical protein